MQVIPFPSSQWAEQFPENIAICWERGEFAFFSDLPSQLSWQQWHHLLCQTVQWLKQQGANHQTLVAYSGSSRFIGVLCYSAVVALNARILMLNPDLTESQRTAILAENGVEIWLTDQDFADFPLNLPACPLPLLSLDTPATLTLTSGSSGKPKAVVHSVANHLASAESVCEFTQFTAENQWLLSLPLFHVSGQGIIWRWLSVGATLVISEDKADFYDRLAEVSHASLVPTQLQRYLAHSACRQTQEQHILLGGAFIPPELIQQAQSRGITTYAGYGMTEMASTICAVKNECDNVGLPLKYREVKIVAQEIWVRGNTLGLGYWQRGKVHPFTNADGWFQSKDKGEFLSDGKLIVKGRLDNLFISGGENIQPEEVEAVLFSSNLLKFVCVVPVLDREFGERPVAFIEFVEPFSSQAVNQLQHFVSQHLEKFKQPIWYFPFEPNQWQHCGIKISRKQLAQYAKENIESENEA